MKKKRVGDVLRERGALSEQELRRALEIQQEKNARLGEVLLGSLRIAKDEIAVAIEQVQGSPYAPCPPPMIEPDVLELIPQYIALRCCALPLEMQGNTLVVAMAEPQDLSLVDELRFRTGRPISVRFSFREDILAGIKKFYEGDEIAVDSSIEHTEDQAPEGGLVVDHNADDLELITAISRDDNQEALKELNAGKDTLAVRLVSMILAKAAERKASDIHIEPRVGDAAVRLRIDGILREVLRIPAANQASVISRIKILADMDISERRLPQDGRFLMIYRKRRLDLRVSTLPTYFGEKIVMRVLDPRSTATTFQQLGFSAEHSADISELLRLPQGMIIVTGPTGSGKSTTLYAALKIVSTPGRNVITVEDPVEYMLDGVNQVQVNPRIGLTFASCLPPILRQDPDVVMIGEIRDAETAEIALRASQTGHLVFSTMHTNDSIGAITRLRNLGIPPYLISSVSGVIGQRLLRRLCDCKKEVAVTAEYIRALATIGNRGKVSKKYEPGGCSACDYTGYKGRVGTYELLSIYGPIRDLILEETPPDSIRSLLYDSGFRTMCNEALDKIGQGITTLEEVLRVVPREEKTPAATRCGECETAEMPEYMYCPFCGSPYDLNSAREDGVGDSITAS